MYWCDWCESPLHVRDATLCRSCHEMAHRHECTSLCVRCGWHFCGWCFWSHSCTPENTTTPTEALTAIFCGGTAPTALGRTHVDKPCSFACSHAGTAENWNVSIISMILTLFDDTRAWLFGSLASVLASHRSISTHPRREAMPPHGNMWDGGKGKGRGDDHFPDFPDNRNHRLPAWATRGYKSLRAENEDLQRRLSELENERQLGRLKKPDDDKRRENQFERVFIDALIYHLFASFGLEAASASDAACVRASLFDALSTLINSSNQTNFHTIQREMMRTLQYSAQSKPPRRVYRTTIEIEMNVTSGYVNTLKALFCAIIASTTTLAACCQYLLSSPIIASFIITCIVLCLTM
jgi:hypothetical protein